MIAACKNGTHKDVVKLIDKGASTYLGAMESFHEESTFSPIHFLVKKKKTESIDLFLERELSSSDSIENDRRETLLHWACYYGDRALIDYLLSKPINIDAIDGKGRTALIWACYMGFHHIVEQLACRGASLQLTDDQNNTPLYWACYQGYCEIIEFLLEEEVDISKKNNAGYTVLDIAVENGQTCAVRLLLNHNSLSSEKMG